MRLALITTSYPSHEGDPSGHFVRAEVLRLLDQGHSVTVFAPSFVPPLSRGGTLRVESLPDWGLFGWPGALERVKRWPLRALGVLPFALAARRRIAQTGPYDAFVAHWLLPSFWPIARDFVGETTALAHGSDVRLLERLPAPIQRRVLKSLGRPNVKLRCVSSELEAVLRRLATLHQLSLGHVQIEPCAISPPSLPDAAELRRVLDVTERPLVVVVGRAVKDKQISIALEAVKQAFDTSPVVIGDGPELPALRLRFPKVRFLGQRTYRETQSWIKAADILLSASEKEGAPTVIREARALGTSVVCANAGDVRIWAEQDDSLHVVFRDARDDRRLAQALADTLTHVWTHTAASISLG